MQANSTEHYPTERYPINNTPPILGATSELIDGNSLEEDFVQSGSEPNCFHGQFASCMAMYADARMVAEYLDAHRAWFPRCAHPMTVEPIGENGYALTIGRYGSFGYEVEPKVGLDLLPQDQGIYRIQTILVPGYTPPGYNVDFRAALQLREVASDYPEISAQMTQVEWELDLKVVIHFPRFIQKLPKSLIQTTGDRLLNQIVRQVSRRLTHKVQVDFHESLGIPFPQQKYKNRK